MYKNSKLRHSEIYNKQDFTGKERMRGSLLVEGTHVRALKHEEQ